MAVPADVTSYFNKIKSEAKRKMVPFSLTKEDIAELLQDNQRCPITDEVLFNSKGRGGKKNTPNFVRLVPEEGFAPDNVMVVGMKARTMRQDATPTQLRRLASMIAAAERRSLKRRNAKTP